MTTAENKDVVRRLIAEGWVQGNLEVIDHLISPEFLNHNPNLPFVTDRSSLTEWMLAMRSNYQNLRINIDDLLGEGDEVVARLTLRGSPAAAYQDPAGRPFVVQGMVICRLDAAQIIEAWWLIDIFSMFKQIGVAEAEVVA